MLIGYRYEERDGVLRIRAVNWVLRLVPWLPVALYSAALPLLPWGKSGVMEILYFLALAVPTFILAAICIWTLTINETLELDMPHKRGLWRCSSPSGAEQEETFFWKGGEKLQLRRVGVSGSPNSIELWLLMHNGGEYPLNFRTVPVRPGKAKTDAWLRRIAGHLHLEVPGEIIEATPLQARASAARKHPFFTQVKSEQALGDMEKFGPATFATGAFVGGVFAIYGYVMTTNLQSAFSSGTMWVPNGRMAGNIPTPLLHWNDSPLELIINWAMCGGLEHFRLNHRRYLV